MALFEKLRFLEGEQKFIVKGRFRIIWLLGGMMPLFALFHGITFGLEGKALLIFIACSITAIPASLFCFSYQFEITRETIVVTCYFLGLPYSRIHLFKPMRPGRGTIQFAENEVWLTFFGIRRKKIYDRVTIEVGDDFTEGDELIIYLSQKYTPGFFRERDKTFEFGSRKSGEKIYQYIVEKVKLFHSGDAPG